MFSYFFVECTLGPHSEAAYLDDVDKLLFVFHGPVDLVVVTSAKVNHNVLVPEEEHARARIVQLVPGEAVARYREKRKDNSKETEKDREETKEKEKRGRW